MSTVKWRAAAGQSTGDWDMLMSWGLEGGSEDVSIHSWDGPRPGQILRDLSRKPVHVRGS